MSAAFLRGDLAPRPQVSMPPDYRFPDAAEHTLDNGLRVVVHDLPGQHVATAALVIDHPLSDEPRALEGITTITARVLDEGTHHHPGPSFAEALSDEGAVMSLSVAQAGLQVFVDAPMSRIGRVLPLFAEAIISPALEPADVERHISLRLAEIDQVLSRQSSLAPLVMRFVLLSDQSRAARLSGGSPDSLARLTPQLVRDHHREVFVPERATLVLGGDFTHHDPLPLIRETFGSWQGNATAAPTHVAPLFQPPRTVVVHQPDAVQNTYIFGGPGIDRTSEHWSPLRVAAHSMGGAFFSRLNRVLREDRGYTYGVSMSLAPFRVGGAHQVVASVRPEVASRALAETIELARMDHASFTDQEITDALMFTRGVSPLQFATAAGVVDQTALNILHGLPIDYINHQQAELGTVTPQSATEAYRRTIQPDQWSLAVIGDAEALVPAVTDAGLAEPQVLQSHDLLASDDRT